MIERLTGNPWSRVTLNPERRSHPPLPLPRSTSLSEGSTLIRRYRRRTMSGRKMVQLTCSRCSDLRDVGNELQAKICHLQDRLRLLPARGRGAHPPDARALAARPVAHDRLYRARHADAVGFEAPAELLAFALETVKIEGHYLEFGVFTGGTIRFIARKVGDRVVHGFDSFQGLPEDWSGYNLGQRAFNTAGRLPRVPDNVRLHPDWFESSIPGWLEANPGPVAFIHVDCDLYTSTRTIFTLLAERIVPGTVIVFDEYFNYPNWERHEFRAFQEFVTDRAVRYRYLGFSRQQVAVRVEAIGHRSA